VQAIDGRIHECLWAHPPEAGDTGRVVFDGAELGRSLRFGGGVAADAQGGDGPPVVLRARVDGVEVGRVEAPWRSRWVERSVAVEPGAHELSFEITAASAARRFFCFEATSW
jgi:hypothetical protein